MTDKELVARMGRATDRLTSSLEAAASALPKFGVTAEVQLAEEDGVLYLLAYSKHGNTWRLVLRTSRVGESTYEQQPITNVSRRYRMLAATKMEQLLSALRTKAREEAERLESLTEDVERFHDGLLEEGGAA